MLWLAKIKKRLPFNRRRRRVNKALRRRKLEKYMPVILFLLGLLAIMIAIVALLAGFAFGPATGAVVSVLRRRR